MSRHLYRQVAERFFVVVALTLAVLVPVKTAAAEESHPLQLEVYINNAPTRLIGSFIQLADRRIAARRAELEELGLKIPGSGSADDLVTIDTFPDVTYRYDEPTQKIFFTVGDELRMRKVYDAPGRSAGAIPERTDYGGVLNYNLFTATNSFFDPRGFLYGGTSLTLDGRGFSPYGTFSQSAILRTSFDHQIEALRLDSTFAYSSQGTLTTYRAGDTITGGLAWTRPVRIGGLQVQRNFGVRPDLVTLPLPSVTGTAAVPSTIDVYINNMKSFSQDIGTGPYQITNLPVVTGGGIARVIVRDSSGHETVTSQPFYASPSLLAPGLSDFSVEAGMPRLSYGSAFDTYVTAPVASASLRKGIFDWLTIESHAEAGSGLVNGGAGAVLRLGATGVTSAAVATSRQNGSNGFQTYLSYETSLLGIRINASSQRTFGSYDDLASVTARFQPIGLTTPQGYFGFFQYLSPNIAATSSASFWVDTRPPKQLDRISIGLPPLSFDFKSSLSASFVNLVTASGIASRILSTSWSRSLPLNASIFATAFADFGDRRNAGIFAGLSMSFGNVSTALSVSGGNGRNNVTFDAVKPLEEKPGSYGWRIRDSEGAAPYRSAAVSYRSSFARVETAVANDRNGTRATAEVDGAVATMGGGVFLANRINDAFAVVDTGVPGVGVFYENRPVGTTDSSGKLLIPSLRAYQKNKIAIDMSTLPVDADIVASQDIVAPADRSGALVKFPIRTDTNSAVLVLSGPDGKPLPVGSQGQVDNGGTFIVGYDGRAFVKGLKSSNTVGIMLPDRQCRASFAYVPRPGEQVVISPVVCE